MRRKKRRSWFALWYCHCHLQKKKKKREREQGECLGGYQDMGREAAQKGW
jgi:hypothetical protein